MKAFPVVGRHWLGVFFEPCDQPEMTNEELLALIDGDATASAFAREGNDVACAERCMEIAPLIRRPVNAIDLRYEAMLTGDWGRMKVTATDQSVSASVRALCHQFIDQVEGGGAIDFELPEVQQMQQMLLQVGVLSQQAVTAALQRSWVRQTIAWIEVSNALAPRRAEGRSR